MKSPVKPHISLFGGINVIIGIVVGVSIFRVSPTIFSNACSPLNGLLFWLLGGMISLIGALCYAELATAYPDMGGDYTYLSRAFHPSVGFIFGWSRLVAIQTGSIGSLAFVFSDYMTALTGHEISIIYAIGVVLIITTINIMGVRTGQGSQNILSVAKVVGLSAIVIFAIAGPAENAFEVTESASGPGMGLAMILVLYAYGGWNETAFVAAEIENPQKNIAKSLYLGTAIVTVIYLIINYAYILGLGFEGLRNSTVPAADLIEKIAGGYGSSAMSILVIISVLGAINGTIITGARVNVAMGNHHSLFAILKNWNQKMNSPVWSLLIQAAVTILMILSIGTEAFRNMIDRSLVTVGLDVVPWDFYGGGFETIVSATAPVFWFFFLLTSISLFVLRYKEPERKRFFTVPLYPLTPFLFSLSCLYMLHSSLRYAGNLSLFGILPTLAGLLLYSLNSNKKSQSE